MKSDLYNNISVSYESSISPIQALKTPITKERIISQITKTMDTPFSFEEIIIEMDDDIFIPRLKEINELRREILSQIETIIINRIQRNQYKNLSDTEITNLINEFINNKDNNNLLVNSKTNTNLENSNITLVNTRKNNSNKKIKEISLYLNEIHTGCEYSKLSKEYISEIYIPLRHFANKKYSKELEEITQNFKTYIYIPAIVKSNYKNIIMHSLRELIEKYKISGFVISNLGDFILLQNYKEKYEFIGNFSLNVFNQVSIDVLAKLGLSKITLSPELNINDINNIANYNNTNIKLELIVYGNAPVMKMNYCLLGKSNKCYPECEMKCRSNNKYYLKDRLGFNFRILPDNIQTVTTIFNSKITSITDINSNVDSFRIDCIDESIDEMNYIAKSAFFGNKIEGKQYTRGNLYREV